VTAFLNSQTVRRFFGRDLVWQLASTEVYGEFEREMACNFHQILPDLLHEGLRILVFAGDRDLACNWMGSLAWMKELRWRGMIGFRKATPFEYEVYGIGHSVAMEAPQGALKMVDDFLYHNL
ncbi:hypothetical protein FOZ63_030953, partial [Perkinsus olseni]